MRLVLPLIVLALLPGCEALQDELTDNYFIKLQPGVANVGATVSDLGGAFGIEPIFVFDRTGGGFTARIPGVLVPVIEDSSDVVEWVIRDEDREYVPPEDGEEPDEDLPTDGSPPQGGDRDTPAVFDPTEITPGIARIGGPYPYLPRLEGVEVAVLDTGVAANHPDLNVVGYYDAVGQRTGRVVDGEDPQGHGTHVAGTIGALADGKGVLGVAPGVPIHAVRVLDDRGSGTWGDIIAGLEYVLDNPAIRVVNMSLGGPRSGNDARDPLRLAIQRVVDTGVVVVIAAGNEAQDVSNVAPAGYDIGLIVSAYDASRGDNGFASFSNFGGAIDVTAPGVSINSTWPGGGYRNLSGTSMAAPHVAGVAAAALAANPDLTPDEVFNLIVSTSEDGFQGQGNRHPEGMANLPRAIGDE